MLIRHRRGLLGRVLCCASALCAIACSAPETTLEQVAGVVELPAAWPYSANRPPVKADNGMVASADEYASRVGIEVQQAGGNAVDSAVATHFALAVVHPTAGNLGGGGFMIARLADGTAAALDFREQAPQTASRDMFLDAEGVVTERAVIGHLAAGVPGSVMGMLEAHKRFGTLPWRDLVEPAIRLAEGFEVKEPLAGSLARVADRLRRFESSAAVFLPGGRPPAVGDTLRQPDLGRTLERIAEEGPDGFYGGETADLIVAEMQRGGGIITREDLKLYTTAWRQPIVFEYRGYSVISMPPTSSGGATLAEIANILEGYELSPLGFQSPQAIHLFVEAVRRGFADRNAYLGDPDFVQSPIERMISDDYAAERRASIDVESATPSVRVAPGLDAVKTGGHTTHYSIVDGAGNAVSVTTTINSGYGSKVTVTGGGFLLNNEMDNFAAKPGSANQYGLVQGEANAIAPGKRMLSSMSPSIVLDPDARLFLLTGTPGGPTIITTVFQTMSNVIDFGMDVTQAVAAPRVHHQHLPDVVRVDADGLRPETIAALRAKGHSVEESDRRWGDAQMIMVMPDGTLEGSSDPRGGGVPVGY